MQNFYKYRYSCKFEGTKQQQQNNKFLFMFLKNLAHYRIILASQSPRRQNLLKELGIAFDIVTKDVDEVYPDTLKAHDIALYLASVKSKAYESEINERTILITADTIVWLGDKVLEKPKDINDAKRMLRKLSGRMHTVYTGVCIATQHKKTSFYASSDVYFKNLDNNEIDYYAENFKPLDKAGAYGIQEWLGYIAIEHIEGSYFNIMGLPTHKLYEELRKF